MLQTKCVNLMLSPPTLQRQYWDLYHLYLGILSTSLTSATFISDLKQALLKPLLKKADLLLIFKYYRPVSNLSVVSKLVECVVFDQVTEYTARNGNIGILNHCSQDIKKKKNHLAEMVVRQIYFNCLTGKKLHVSFF